MRMGMSVGEEQRAQKTKCEVEDEIEVVRREDKRRWRYGGEYEGLGNGEERMKRK